MRAIDLTGQRFGRLVVLARAEARGRGAHWRCQCDCGAVSVAEAQNLQKGRTRSCGCGRVVHRDSYSAEYAAWQAMLYRCLKPTAPAWPNYGGRGITVCDRWRHSYENFLADMGRRPSPDHSLDRFPDNDGPYSPDNCRWATPTEQGKNRRRPPREVVEKRRAAQLQYAATSDGRANLSRAARTRWGH